jgi:hypothetical protein
MNHHDIFNLHIQAAKPCSKGKKHSFVYSISYAYIPDSTFLFYMYVLCQSKISINVGKTAIVVIIIIILLLSLSSSSVVVVQFLLSGACPSA